MLERNGYRFIDVFGANAVLPLVAELVVDALCNSQRYAANRSTIRSCLFLRFAKFDYRCQSDVDRTACRLDQQCARSRRTTPVPCATSNVACRITRANAKQSKTKNEELYVSVFRVLQCDRAVAKAVLTLLRIAANIATTTAQTARVMSVKSVER
jgi:hypothetical protein